MKRLTLIAILFSVSLYSEEGTLLWKGFNTNMTPDDVVIELNSMELYKSKAKVNKMPKRPKYRSSSSYNLIPVLTKNRVNQRIRPAELGSGLKVRDVGLNGPFFEFDEQDNLAEIRFKLHLLPGAKFSWCGQLLSDDAQSGFELLKALIEKKYPVEKQDINYGRDSKSVIHMSDGTTKVWLVKKEWYKKSTDDAMYKCNKDVGSVTLHYAALDRVENLSNENIDSIIDEVEDAF